MRKLHLFWKCELGYEANVEMNANLKRELYHPLVLPPHMPKQGLFTFVMSPFYLWSLVSLFHINMQLPFQIQDNKKITLFKKTPAHNHSSHVFYLLPKGQALHRSGSNSARTILAIQYEILGYFCKPIGNTIVRFVIVSYKNIQPQILSLS